MAYRHWVALFILAMGLSGCFSSPLAESRYQLGDYRVTERIYREDGFPDPTFERVLEVQHGSSTMRLGAYRDESREGITVAPEWVGEWLVVYSSSHLFVWRPGVEARHFAPWEADGWTDYAARFGPCGLGGHYDYHAAHFWIEGGRWFVEYRCNPGYCVEGHPSTILFTSDDEGATYAIVDDAG